VTIKRVTSEDGKRLLNSINKLQDRNVKVGWIKKSTYPETDESVASIAAQNEFGNAKKHIPARPFMRPTIAAKQNEWKILSENGAKKVIKGQMTIDNVLDLIGFQAESDIKKTIKQLYSPALAEKTILARIERNKKLSTIKGRISEKSLGNVTKPLIDTGIMFNTITHEVS
jgi:hypothetical protein